MAKVFNKLSQMLSLHWLAGPILGKELRISSRRKRFYFLRSLYIAFLLGIVIIAWLDLPYYSRFNVSAYMAQIGQNICHAIAIFQFFGVQVVAILLLSSAISEEINKRTLGLLLTTPITGMQMIGGKISSRLLQVFFLLCLSLPVLAIVRVFGGVPWSMIVQTTCVTVAAVIFVSSLVLCVSTIFKRSYTVLIFTSVIVGLLYSSYNYYGFRRIIYRICNHSWTSEWIIRFANPYALLMDSFETYGRSGYLWGGRYAAINLPIGLSNYEPMIFIALRCAAIIAISFFLFLIAAWRIRKIAIKQMVGEKKNSRRHFSKACEALINKLPRISRNRPLRTVRGQAVVWKETHNSLIRNELLRGRMIYIVLITAIAVVYFLYLMFIMGGAEEALFITILIIFCGACLMSAIIAAASISKEKETSSWQILLSTPLTNSEIIWGKLAGTLRRSCVLWFLLCTLCAVLTYTKLFYYPSLYMVPMITIGTILLIAGIGMYFSLKCKNASYATIAVIGILTALWLVPIILLSIGPFRRYYYHYDIFEILLAANPFTQVLSLCDMFHPYYYGNDFWETHIFISINAIVHAAIGLLFIWRTKVNIRKIIV